jgi:O-antigen/teichoic acid export membrane protein
MLRPSVLLLLFSVGTTLALLLAVFRQPLLALLFGNPFVVAAPLLLLLTAAIPLDFLTSYLSNAYIAWGFEKRVLVCTMVAAAVEIVLNAVGIPRFGALAAAVNTLIAYLVLLVGLAVVAKWLNRMPRPRAEEIL